MEGTKVMEKAHKNEIKELNATHQAEIQKKEEKITKLKEKLAETEQDLAVNEAVDLIGD